MLKRIVIAIACVTVGLLMSIGYGAVAQTRPAAPTSTPASSPAPSSRLAPVDQAFMQMAGEAAVANISLSQLALQRGTSAEVKQFAQAELNEQQQVRQDLSRLAPRYGVNLPTTPNSLHQALAKKMSQLAGEQFDRAYLNEGGVNAHLENASVFQREAQFGETADVVAVANKGLPIIGQHFNTASRLTDYQFARVAQRFNTPSRSGTPASQSPNAPATGVTR